MIGRPIILTREFIWIIKARLRYRSPTQDPANMYSAAKRYGGVPRHCDSTTLNRRLFWRTMGKKNANEYETVVTRLSGHLNICDEYFWGGTITYKKIKAKHQISTCLAGARNFFSWNGSGSASPRSASSRLMTVFSSSCFRNQRLGLDNSSSGNLTISMYASMPTAQVMTPSMMKILPRLCQYSFKVNNILNVPSPTSNALSAI